MKKIIGINKNDTSRFCKCCDRVIHLDEIYGRIYTLGTNSVFKSFCVRCTRNNKNSLENSGHKVFLKVRDGLDRRYIKKLLQ